MVSCLMGDSTALASAIVRCCLKTKEGFPMIRPVTEKDIPTCGYLQIPLPKITEER